MADHPHQGVPPTGSEHPQVVLHIGTHKTGSTSLQHFLSQHAAELPHATGLVYPKGLVVPTAHSELALLTIRPERTWPARMRFPEVSDARWLEAARASVESLVHSLVEVRVPRTLVLSHEDLSYARHADEVERLRELLSPAAVRVVVYLREPTAFLRSYASQLVAAGFTPSADPSSFAYVEPDSWVADGKTLVATYQEVLGRDHVEVLRYDEVVTRDGSIIPSFTDLLGVPRSALAELPQPYLNRTGQELIANEEQVAAIRRRLSELTR